MANRTHVPDKLEAFMLQVRHAMLELICATEESNIISVEAFDDVAIENGDGIVAEQLKSSVSEENPLANRSVSFWKTLYNWCVYIKSESLDPSKLKLIVVSSHAFTPGSIPNGFAKAKTRPEAEAALKQAEEFLIATSKGGKLASEECMPYIKYCFDKENEDSVLQVIQLFSYELHNGTYDDTLKSRFYEQLVPPEYADVLLLTMLGWVEEKIHSFTRNNKPAFISKKEFNDVLRKEIRGRNQSSILSAVSTQPDNATTGLEVERHDTYIKQLELINMDTGDLFSAASDYLMASAEKTEWAKRGLVTDHSFDDYNAALKRSWDSNKRTVNILYSISQSEEQQGQLLYNECQKAVLTIRLQGCSVPNFFGSGSLQSLANEPEDSPQIGWHPKYCDLLKESDKNAQD